MLPPCAPNQAAYKVKFSSSCPFLPITRCSKTQKEPEATEGSKLCRQAPMHALYKDSRLNHVQRQRTATVKVMMAHHEKAVRVWLLSLLEKFFCLFTSSPEGCFMTCLWCTCIGNKINILMFGDPY